MQLVRSRLKKLQGKGLRELSVRGRQEVAKLGERVLGLSVGEMSDRAFLRNLKQGVAGNSAEEAALGIVGRIRASVSSSRYSSQCSFFPSLGYRGEIVAAMEQRFGDERKAIIDRAQRAVEGRFDLLGFTNLSFGDPPDWLLEPMSGKRAPLTHWSRIDYLDPLVVGDKKITWELNRLQHFVTLGQAYWMTSDETYAEAFVSQATSWMDTNPPNRGINWASSLELAFRSIAWLWALHLFAGSRHVSATFILRSMKHLMAHGLHIQSHLSQYFSPNTHLTGEALGLFYLGTALCELRCAESWRKLGLRVLVEELSRQVRKDGVYFEQATYYHRYTADFYTHLLLLARAGRIELPAEVEETLTQMLTHLMWITRPDGTSPLTGDDDGGRLVVLGSRRLDDFRDTLATGAALFDHGDWKHAAGEAAVETLWLVGPEGLKDYDGIQSAPPTDHSRVFELSGYSVVRDGWSRNSTCVLMDLGPHGSLACGHAHADALAIEFSALGKAWIIDPGTFTYTADSGMRNWFRSTEAHNTVTVDGESQSSPAGVFSWSNVAQAELEETLLGDGFAYLAGSHDGYMRLADPVRHTRAIIAAMKDADAMTLASLPSYLVVRDTFTASDRHDYAIRYHLAPGCSAFAIENRVIVTEPDGTRLTIAVFGQTTLQAQVTEGWISRAYGQRESAPVAVFCAEGEGAQQFISVIMPGFKTTSIRIEQIAVSGTTAQGFVIASGNVRDVLLLGDGPETINCESLTSDGAASWARFENDEFTRGFLVHGRVFETRNGFSFRSEDLIKHCVFRRAGDGICASVNGGDLFDVTMVKETEKVVIQWANFEVYREGAQDAGNGSRGESVPASEAIN